MDLSLNLAERAGESHIASIVIQCHSAAVFAFMTDPEKLERWSFGTWHTEISPTGLVVGTAIFDGSKTLLKIEADVHRLSIDYHLGTEPHDLVPRIYARIMPGPMVGLDDDSSVLTLVAWRTAAMDNERWRKLRASHEFEVVLIKNLLESGRG
jgi:uncharacterized protein YndB with AHSA1/START domain